jgi:hypothetical protein
MNDYFYNSVFRCLRLHYCLPQHRGGVLDAGCGTLTDCYVTADLIDTLDVSFRFHVSHV